MRKTIQDLISSITPWDALEAEHIAFTQDWINSGAGLFRLEKPATPDPHLVSYFLLVDGDHLLLVDHRKAGLWLPSGGHVDPGEHPTQTVRRELREELSIEADFLAPDPQFLTVCRTIGQGAHLDISLWYLLKGDRQAQYYFDTEEFHAIRWFHRDEVPFEKADPNMKRFLDKVFAPQR